jgi:dephospho-CoA kinase
VKLVGLGGGIGAGKSTVSSQLHQRFGAVIVDADKIARQVVEPGTPGLAAIAERFGSGVIAGDGTLLRQALADIVFSDRDALAALNAITHPAIGAETARQIGAHTGSDAVVIYDAALLFDTGRSNMVGRMVVDVDPETAVARLVSSRGLREDDARARIAAQMSRSDRIARADLVIDNSGSEEELAREVGRAWAWIRSLPETPRP